jgi:dihydroorotase
VRHTARRALIVRCRIPDLSADVAILELRNGTFEFLDNYNNKRTGTQRLFPVATVLGGKQTPARA